MTPRPRAQLLRRTAVVGATLLALTACTADASDDPAPAASASGGPVVVGAEEYEPILEVTLPVPGSEDGDETTVGLVSLVASGPTTELRLVLTPSFPSLEEGEDVSIFDMFGSHNNPQLWDIEGVRTYDIVRDGPSSFETDVVHAATGNGEPLLYQAFFPTLEGRPETVDLVLHPAWPVIQDVPVTYEG